jgi:signal transduction histidine kinase
MGAMNSEIEALGVAMMGRIASRSDATEVMNGIAIPFLEPDRERLGREHEVRSEERRRERARIARELHDTLFQGFLGASLLLHTAVEQTPSDAPSRLSLTRALQVIQRVIDEGRVTLQGLRSPAAPCLGLEEALCSLRKELSFDPSTHFRVFVMGRAISLNPELHEQIYFIAREAVANALRHSGAKNIEVEIEYVSRRLRLTVRDDGCGMDQHVVQTGRNSHWGLLGMRERAEGIGAQFRIWSRPGAGTEVEVTAPLEIPASQNLTKSH